MCLAYVCDSGGETGLGVCNCAYAVHQSVRSMLCQSVLQLAELIKELFRECFSGTKRQSVVAKWCVQFLSFTLIASCLKGTSPR